MAEIRFGVKLDIVHHAAIERVPKVPHPSGLATGHAEVVPESSEVGLPWHTDRYVIRNVMGGVGGASIIAYIPLSDILYYAALRICAGLVLQFAS